LVLVRRKGLKKKGKTKKFLPKFIGPFQVVKKVCPTTYLVEDLPALRRKKKYRRFNAHVVQIRKFHARDDVEWDDWPEEDTVDVDTPTPAQATPEITEENLPTVQPLPVITNRYGRKINPPAWHANYVRDKEDSQAAVDRT
jgi:hypothetical protein